MPGSKVMRQRGAETLVTEEPDELIAHVRVCGGRAGNHRLYPEADAPSLHSGALLSLSVCAVHAAMRGSASLLSRGAWSRRTREAQGRSREGASAGSVEQTCGARDTNRIPGVIQPERAGTRP
jgi:hypothetical protein